MVSSEDKIYILDEALKIAGKYAEGGCEKVSISTVITDAYEAILKIREKIDAE